MNLKYMKARQSASLWFHFSEAQEEAKLIMVPENTGCLQAVKGVCMCVLFLYLFWLSM